MKSFVLCSFLVIFSLLGIRWQEVSAQIAPLRQIEISEIARSLTPSLVAELNADPETAARAALAIGRTKKSDGAAALRAHLTASDAGLRTMVVYALGLLSDVASLQNVRDLAHRDPASSVRYAAVDAIGRIISANPSLGDSTVSDDLLLATRTDTDPIVRGHAAAQLDVFKTAPFAQSIASALERVMQSEDDQNVRWHVMWTLSRSFAPLASREFLSEALHDPNEVVRLEAARAWGRRTDSDAESIVKVALFDRSWRVQYEAREAIRRLRKEAPTDHLKEIPEGIVLPPIPSPVVASVTPPPSPAPQQQKLLPPDPQYFELESFDPPVTAFAMNQGRPGRHERMRIRTTKGDVTIALYREWAPSTVANFIQLAQNHYFDGNRWFRIVPDFVVQTGDPSGSGDGDAGYAIPAEENPVEERSGVIAMGLNYDKNMPLRDSAGTQFYITLSPQLHLDRSFSVFGEVTDGFDVLAHLVESDRIVSVTEVADS